MDKQPYIISVYTRRVEMSSDVLQNNLFQLKPLLEVKATDTNIKDPICRIPGFIHKNNRHFVKIHLCRTMIIVTYILSGKYICFMNCLPGQL